MSRGGRKGVVAADPKDVRRRAAARSSRGRLAHARKRDRGPRDGHEQFELVQEALGIVTWIWDLEPDLARWYGDVSRLLGLHSGRFSGRFADYLAHLHPEDAEKAKQVYVDCMRGRTPEYRAEERVVWPDGSVHWLETYGRAEYGADARAVRMAGVIKDISAAKREEAARVRAEHLLARVFDASPEYITVVRARDGAFVAANAAFERVTGFRAAEIVGRTVDELELWGDAAERDRFRTDLQRDGVVHERPTMLRLRDGTVISGMLSASLVEHDGERLVVSVVHDVSEARLLQRRAQQSERKFATVFMTSPDPVAISRQRDGVHLDVNDAWVRATGHARQDAVGRSSHELGLWQDPAARRDVLAQLDAAGAVHGVPARFARARGEDFPALVSGAKVTLDGEACVVWAWRDIGELSSALGQARQAESMFSALFESSPEPITLYRISDGMRLAANGAWERLSGFDRELAVGRPADDTKMWHDDAQGSAVLARLESEVSVSNVEAQLKRVDGSAFDALISGVRIDLDGEPCILWSWRDTGELKRLEQRARHGERMFAALFESSPEPITLFRIAVGVRLAANSAWERATGHSRETVTGRPAVAATLFRDPLQREALLQRAIAADGISNAEVRLLRADGTEFDALISAARVDVEGEPCMLWTWRDLSQVRQLEQQAQQSERKFASMFETTPVAMLVSRALPGHGADDLIVEINDAA